MTPLSFPFFFSTRTHGTCWKDLRPSLDLADIVNAAHETEYMSFTSFFLLREK